MRAGYPLQVIHADVTILRLKNNSRAYIYLLMDNFSRHILSWRVSSTYSSKIAIENIREACLLYGIDRQPATTLVCDGGIENHGEVSSFINRDDVYIDRLIAGVDIRCSNSLIEAYNKQLKYNFLYRTEFEDIDALSTFMKEAVENQANRPLAALNGKTSNEVIGGQTPEKDSFSMFIKEALQARIALNRKCDLCKVS